MATIKRDDVKQKWEETEFPLVCETCLGDNPYVRMTKEPHGKKCRICDTPFTVFAWQAGTRGRLKKVEICKSCAQAKNVCQVCIYDLQYGLPVQVRDKILRESGSTGALANVPQSQANRSWYTAQQERALEQGQNTVGNANALAHAQLQSMARMEPRYERNLPKLCSFFARGECDRGVNCPFRHELPKDRNDPLAKQSTKNRFFGTNDPVAGKIIARRKRQEEEAKKDSKGEDGYDERSRATCYVRFQSHGDGASLSKITEADVRDEFYSFGEIVAVRFHGEKGVFVEYTQPEATELAVATMDRKSVKGRSISVVWARAPKRGNAAQSSQGRGEKSASASSGVVRAAAPPGGMSKARLPSGMKPVRPPPEVAAIAAARKASSGKTGSSISGLPRPGGGVIRGTGIGAAKKVVGSPATKPYYPSADPGRLGSRTAGAGR